jgi:phosphonate transport system permease protein
MSGPAKSEVERLKAGRKSNRFLAGSMVALILLAGYGIVSVAARSDGFLGERQVRNLSRFLDEIQPHGEDGEVLTVGEWGHWAGRLFRDRGYDAATTTLAISVVAIVLAGLFSVPLCLLAARTIATPEAFAPAARHPHPAGRAAWLAVTTLTRVGFVLLRALPEYVWAFLLLMALGPSPWAAVLALVVHNVGILGRLYAETVENLPPRVPSALRGLGAGRGQVAVFGLAPAVIPRFVLYFFYRWETCVREATVLGMLGIVSLGYFILDARAHNHYDEMVFFVLLGAAIVIVGDVVSAVARRAVRRAG